MTENKFKNVKQRFEPSDSMTIVDAASKTAPDRLLGIVPLRTFDEVGVVFSEKPDDIYARDSHTLILTKSQTREVIRTLQKSLDELTPDYPISLLEFDRIEAGDSVRLMEESNDYNASVSFAAARGSVLSVVKTDTDGTVLLTGFSDNEVKWWVDRTDILEVVKKVTKHYHVKLSDTLWYAGSKGRITADKKLAIVMNKSHAENVVKKYGGSLVEVEED